MIEILKDDAIETILGQQLWEDGVYVNDSLTISMTIFQLKAIAQAAQEYTLRQVVEWGDEDCPHNPEPIKLRVKRGCTFCWQELKENDAKLET